MQGDPSLTDDDLQGEIDLVGALVLAAAEAEGPMSQSTIDEVLGVGGAAPADQPAPTGDPAEGVVAGQGPGGAEQ